MESKICRNPWCKAKFTYTEIDLIKDENGELISPNTCKKCDSFDNDLSGGVIWKTKEYDGSIFDNQPHSFKYKIKKYF